jgi:hypothetical protein
VPLQGNNFGFKKRRRVTKNVWDLRDAHGLDINNVLKVAMTTFKRVINTLKPMHFLGMRLNLIKWHGVACKRRVV